MFNLVLGKFLPIGTIEIAPFNCIFLKISPNSWLTLNGKCCISHISRVSKFSNQHMYYVNDLEYKNREPLVVEW